MLHAIGIADMSITSFKEKHKTKILHNINLFSSMQATDQQNGLACI
uniref:Uncharacterized protein n=1 Tax=Arundo donax TaxID=35708 RepID=A0A0A9EEQ4_ARUDO